MVDRPTHKQRHKYNNGPGAIQRTGDSPDELFRGGRSRLPSLQQPKDPDGDDDSNQDGQVQPQGRPDGEREEPGLHRPPTQILHSYKRYGGTAISIWETTSVVGVSTAEAMTMPRSAYLRPAASCAGVTIPRRASSTTTSGSWNNSPNERTKAVANEV